MEDSGLCISRVQTEHMETGEQTGERVTMAGDVLQNVTKFKYLGSVPGCDCTHGQDVSRRIASGWTKWRSLTEILCDKCMPLRVKGKAYRAIIRPTMMYGCET